MRVSLEVTEAIGRSGETLFPTAWWSRFAGAAQLAPSRRSALIYRKHLIFLYLLAIATAYPMAYPSFVLSLTNL
jgi:hypothetical protein